MLRLLITILVMTLIVTRANAFEVGNTIAGSARVIDGDTLEISGVRIRLNGVAAPERNELGGAEATTAMKKMTSGKTVRCSLTGKKTYKREVGTCWIGTLDLGAALIAAGKARDCPRYSAGRYSALEPASTANLLFPGYCIPS
jgi:endonuclease YncB( thermonuclease family)